MNDKTKKIFLAFIEASIYSPNGIIYWSRSSTPTMFVISIGVTPKPFHVSSFRVGLSIRFVGSRLTKNRTENVGFRLTENQKCRSWFGSGLETRFDIDNG